MRGALVIGLVLLSPSSFAAEPPAPLWISDDGRVVEMRLAHRDLDRVDGGTLRVDRARRVIVWQGAPNEIGCRHPFEASLDDVVDVALDEPGFTLRLSQGRVREMKMIPLPHFTWLLEPKAAGGIAPNVAEQLRGPIEGRMPIGGPGAGPLPKEGRAVPPPVVREDSARAVRAIREAVETRP